MEPIDVNNPSSDSESTFNFNNNDPSDENDPPSIKEDSAASSCSRYDSESSDWDLEKYKALCGNIKEDSAASSSSSGTTISYCSGRHDELCALCFFTRKKRKAAPMAMEEEEDNHHGSRVVFPTEQAAVSDDLNQPVTEANLPEGLISTLLGLKSSPFVTPPVEKKKSLFQTEALRQLTGSLTKVEGLRFAIVVARFNEIVSKPLLEGALDTFKKYSVREEDIVVVWVPGSFEIGLVAEKLGKSGKYHAILCIGAVVRGDTTNYDVVANSAASGVLSAGLNSGVPCIFGVLTCEDMDKALSHAGGKAGNKGSEAALTAIEMASLFEHHLKE